jgi:hypothetical protein
LNLRHLGIEGEDAALIPHVAFQSDGDAQGGHFRVAKARSELLRGAFQRIGTVDVEGKSL